MALTKEVDMKRSYLMMTLMTMATALASTGCSGGDDPGVAQAAASQACSQTQEEMDAALTEELLSNSCLQGFSVDPTATACAATKGQVAHWVCTECKEADGNTCSNEIDFQFSVNVTVSIRTVEVSGQFSGTAKGSFEAKYTNGNLVGIPGGVGHQPSFDYYRSVAAAKIRQDRGFSGKFTAQNELVGDGITIETSLSCDREVKKTMAQTVAVPEDVCGEGTTCTDSDGLPGKIDDNGNCAPTGSEEGGSDPNIGGSDPSNGGSDPNNSDNSNSDNNNGDPSNGDPSNSDSSNGGDSDPSNS